MQAIELLDQCERLVNKGLSHIKKEASNDGKVDTSRLDSHQQAIYDLAVSYAEVKSAQHFFSFASGHESHEQALSNHFSAEVISSILARLRRAPGDMGLQDKDFELEGCFRTTGCQHR
jgi:hypothetical protein